MATDVALLLKEELERFGLESYVKTSGEKRTSHTCSHYAGHSGLAKPERSLTEIGYITGWRIGKIVVSEASDSKKPGTVYVDYSAKLSWKNT